MNWWQKIGFAVLVVALSAMIYVALNPKDGMYSWQSPVPNRLIGSTKKTSDNVVSPDGHSDVPNAD